MRTTARVTALVAVVAHAVVGVAATPVTFTNPVVHTDVTGAALDAHDGNVFNHGGQYVMVAMGYGNCKEEPSGCANTTVGACGFRLNHTIGVYASPDMAQGSWEVLTRNALPVASRPSAVYYRPKVVFNAATSQFVLWLNAVPGGDFSKSEYVVAVAKAVQGPYSVVTSSVATRYGAGGDFDVFVDDASGSAFLAYTSVANNHAISVEQLAANYTASMPATNAGFIPGATGVEAPSAFAVGGRYYLTFGACCCFCGSGSGVIVASGGSPLGPFGNLTQIGRFANHTSITGGQQNDVFPVDTPSGPVLMLTADQWQHATDGNKAHDPQVWTVVGVDAAGGVQQLAIPPAFTVDVV